MTPQDKEGAIETPMCSELRCKGMYIPKDIPMEEHLIIPGETTHWWCELTQYSLGPDQDRVHRTACTPGRQCYRPPGGPA